MPVLVYQTCQNCHESKLRADNFPSAVERYPVVHRTYGPYCHACLRDKPSLWNELGPQVDSEEEEKEPPVEPA